MVYLGRTATICAAAFFSLMLMVSGCIIEGNNGTTEVSGEDAEIESIQLIPGNASIPIDSILQLSAVGINLGGTQRDLTGSVIWSSSNTAVATISETGLATAVAEGETIVTATSGTISGSTLLTVAKPGTAIIIDHTCTDISRIPPDQRRKARANLSIAYGHTSHGSQITSGMSGLFSWKGSDYAFNASGSGEALELKDNPFPDLAYDLVNPNRTAWADATRAYLNVNPGINVVMWSWCGQISNATEADINLYLDLMSALETEYPNVRFVYMTGHLDGTGLSGNLHRRNEQIREHCRANSRILYDFADIESYDPDGRYFGGKIPNDNCDYDSDGDGIRDANWAEQWQSTHVQGSDWYICNAAHSKPLNANLKAYAAWWLWARLAGWTSR